jgi:hypothetical protein
MLLEKGNRSGPRLILETGLEQNAPEAHRVNSPTLQRGERSSPPQESRRDAARAKRVVRQHDNGRSHGLESVEESPHRKGASAPGSDGEQFAGRGTHKSTPYPLIPIP